MFMPVPGTIMTACHTENATVLREFAVMPLKLWHIMNYDTQLKYQVQVPGSTTTWYLYSSSTWWKVDICLKLHACTIQVLQ